MAKPLILVESAGKARAVKKFIGTTGDVASTDGFLKDLPKTLIGVDENYTPNYITIRGKGKLMKELKKTTLQAGKIYMAFNPDGAGEFLARQCCELFGVDKKTRCRMIFDELTKTAVKDAMKNPRPIDETLINAFQTKQIIDKIVSHKIGEYLSYKIYRGVKVGRFRGMLLKLIDDEQITGDFEIGKTLTSSTLQELAFTKLNFSPTKTRLIVEQLYEGVKLDKNYTGLIKYPHGGEIRLTDEIIAPETVKDFLTDSQFKLYDLIYNAINNGIDAKVTLNGDCNDLSLMFALDAAKVDWAEVYTVGINSLIKRQYIVVEDSKFKVTDLGKRVLNALNGFFDEDFSVDSYNKVTAQVKAVAENAADKNAVIDGYCETFNKNYDAAMGSLPEDAKPQDVPTIESDEICDKCGKPMVIKRGRYGFFLACSGYPDCKNIKPYVEYLEQKCPKCGEGRITKRQINNRNVYGCEKCDFRTWDDPQVTPCRECGSTMFSHKFKDRAPMLYCGNDNCTTRTEHPINKILEDAQRRYENYLNRLKLRKQN